jgi:hypothetical protein
VNHLLAIEMDDVFNALNPQADRQWLLVCRDAIGKLRIGVRAAGISTGEFDALAIRRIESELTRLILLVDLAHTNTLDQDQIKAVIVSLILESQRNFDALSPIPLQLHVRFPKNVAIKDLDHNWCWTELRFRVPELYRIAAKTGLTGDVIIRSCTTQAF